MKKRTLFKLVILHFLMQSALAQTTLQDTIDKLLSAEFKENEPGGVVLVAKEGKILYKKAFGLANMEWQVPMNEGARFYIGSLTKQFTAVAILQLMEQGKLSLQDSMSKYFPGCAAPVGAITIEQLLTHTSGLNGSMAKDGRKDTPKQLVEAFISQPLEFSPGSKWQYSNAGYYLLGYIIEVLSGKTYGDYLDTFIFKPAGMHNSCYGSIVKLIPNIAVGYKYDQTGIVNDRIGNMINLYASGGIISTADDMYAWCRALQSGILIKKETLVKMFTHCRLNNGKTAPYGYAWHLQKLQGSTAYRHGGSVSGFLAEEIYLPQEDVFVVMLCNAQSERFMGALGRIMAGIAIGKPYNFTETTIDAKALPVLQGVYENNFGEKIIITTSKDHLFFQRPGGARYLLKAASAREFFFDKGYLQVQFNADSGNNISHLTFGRVGMNDMEWKKTDQPVPSLFPEKLPDSVLNSYTGNYLLSSGDTIHVIKDYNTIALQFSGKEKQTLFPKTESEFLSLKEPLIVEFNHQRKQGAATLILHVNRKKQEAKKL